MKTKFIYLILLTLLSSTVGAKVQLPEIMSDNMVLQQNTKVKLWGKATPKSVVTITTSWNNKSYTCQADASGEWITPVNTPVASYTPYSITFINKERTTLKNILIGEVWFCSGQSNMEMPLNGFWNCPVKDGNETIANASQNKGVRFVTVPKNSQLTPQKTCPGSWKECNPENACWFSATAYHFATSLSKALNIPVGVINSSWGGSTVEGWMNKELLQNYKDVDLSLAGSNKINPMSQPMIMYNGMLKPLVNYTIKGFLWYQGESNVGKHQTYASRLAEMVKLWRSDWGLGDIPFYFVEIAPYQYGEGDWAAYLREAQFKAQELIPNSGMICTNDLVEDYEATNIHPKNKTLVGKRLCYMALARTYRLNSVCSNGPAYKSMEIKNGEAYISFDGAQDGFSREKGIVGFEIAGEDKIFHPATAAANLNKKIIIVSNEEVSDPVAVRYCFRNFLIGNLYNNREQPVVPFRTDNW